MPLITFKNKKIICEKGANLRDVLIKNGMTPHNGPSRVVNCFGLGSCGTCAVKISGKIAPPNHKEKIRLNLPPHKFGFGLRLSCQVKVHHDMNIEKGEGYWGQHMKDSDRHL